MKLKSILILSLSALSALAVYAGPGHDHPHGGDKHHADDHGHTHAKKTPGPHGGRVVESVKPHIEIFITEDRKMKISVLDDHYKVVDPGALTVTATGGSRVEPVHLHFSKSGTSLISKESLPEGNKVPVVVTIKSEPEAKAVYERFNVNMAGCGSCDYPEYACICGH
jgi:hypothetical protein